MEHVIIIPNSHYEHIYDHYGLIIFSSRIQLSNNGALLRLGYQIRLEND